VVDVGDLRLCLMWCNTVPVVWYWAIIKVPRLWLFEESQGSEGSNKKGT